MQELLAKMVGKKLDMFCGGTSSLRGKLVKVDEGVAHMVDEDDQMFYVAVERIIVFSETKYGRRSAPASSSASEGSKGRRATGENTSGRPSVIGRAGLNYVRK